MQRRTPQAILAVLLCAVYLVTLVPTPAAAAAITQAECDADWLGLHTQECFALDMAGQLDSQAAAQYGWTQADHDAFVAANGPVEGWAASPGALVRGAVHSLGSIASGLTARQAGVLATGLIATTGAGLIGAAGMGARSFLVDEETTDLQLSTGSPEGWPAGNVIAHLGNAAAPTITNNVSAFYGAYGDRVVSFDWSMAGNHGQQPLAERWYLNVRVFAECFPLSGGDEITQLVQQKSVAGARGPHAPGVYSSYMSHSGSDTVDCGSGRGLSAVVFQFDERLGEVYQQVTDRRWVPQGAEDWTPGLDAGMIGTLTTTLNCTSPSGTSPHVFTETFTGGYELDVAAKDCPGGSVLTSANAVWSTVEGDQTVWDYTAPASVQQIPVEFDRCLTAGECGLGLWQTLSGQQAQYCGALAVGCQNWWGDANKLDNYECRVGNEPVDLGMCSMYRKPGQVSPVMPVTVSPDGKVGVGTRVDTLNPEDYDDLQPIPQAPPATNPNPNPNPNPVPQPDPDLPPEISESGARCWPNGWGLFNPAEWVLLPLKCAFMPRDGFIEHQIGIWQTEIFSKPPFVIVTTGTTVIGGLLGGYNEGVCAFPDFLPMSDADLEIPCTPPEGWSTVYGASTVMIWASGLWAGARMVAAGLGNREVPA